MPPDSFEPFFQNAHLATIAANFWKRDLDLTRHPGQPTIFDTEPGVRVMAMTHTPAQPRAELVCLHGLEGSHDSGYLQSLAQAALARGFRVHRLNMRGCGGTEGLSKSLYHAGLTADLRAIVAQLGAERPIFLAGFSLGGNVVLKLAGELGAGAKMAAVAAVSVPLDLHACCLKMMRPENRIYETRFVLSLKKRFARRAAEHPDLYKTEHLEGIKTVIEFDDRITAPYFGFGHAVNYYATQSSQRFLEGIGVPTLLIQAQDDPLIPFDVYTRHAAFQTNPKLRLVATPHGGHVGFIARRQPRFWVDGQILAFFEEQLEHSGV